jgi:chromate reductase
MKVLGLCGSLRKNSFNLKLLNQAKGFASVAPAIDFEVFEALSEIPYFNPDLESGKATTTPASVAKLRQAVQSADRILIASPEYVHGVPGVLKNALDWIVSTGEMDGKIVGIWNLSSTPGEPVWVRDSLKEILNVMSGGRVRPGACVSTGAAKKKFDAQGEITDPLLLQQLEQAWETLIATEITGN